MITKMNKKRCKSLTQKGRKCLLTRYKDFDYCHVHCNTAAQKIQKWWYHVFTMDQMMKNYIRIDGVRSYAMKWLERTRKENQLDEECQICMEPFWKRDITKRNYIKITCGHVFHGICLFTWWKHKNTNTCPCCRKNHIEYVNGLRVFCCLEVTQKSGKKHMPSIHGSVRHIVNNVFATEYRDQFWFNLPWSLLKLIEPEFENMYSNDHYYIFKNIGDEPKKVYPFFIDIVLPNWIQELIETAIEGKITATSRVLRMTQLPPADLQDSFMSRILSILNISQS